MSLQGRQGEFAASGGGHLAGGADGARMVTVCVSRTLRSASTTTLASGKFPSGPVARFNDRRPSAFGGGRQSCTEFERRQTV